MGQQQLLLLILGIVIVGTAVIYGIQAFDENKQRDDRDSEMLKMLDLASRAQVWKTTPVQMGGGLSDDPADFSNFTLEAIGITPSGGPSGSPFVDLPGTGCFRFFPDATQLRINSLNRACVIGSWTKGLIITGTGADDLTWEYRDQ